MGFRYTEIVLVCANGPLNVFLILQVLLDNYRVQMMSAIEQFKNPEYGQFVRKQIEEERERQDSLSFRAAQLEKQVNDHHVGDMGKIHIIWILIYPGASVD